MPHLHDEEGKDDWDGQDWADETTHLRSLRNGGSDPSETAIQAELDRDGYVLDWKAISDRGRAEKDYTCEECRVRLHDQLKLLHVHHIDRDKLDNSPQNLRVLCVVCHSSCEGHEHLSDTISPMERALIELRRTLQQGLPANLKKSTPQQGRFVSRPLPCVPPSPRSTLAEAPSVTTIETINAFYHSYRVIARFWKGAFRARAISYRDKRRIDVEGVSIEDAVRKLTALIHTEIEEQASVQREQLPEIHKARMAREGLPYHGIRKRTGSDRRITHCYSCKSALDNIVDIECAACGWIICRICAACGCGYAGRSDAGYGLR